MEFFKKPIFYVIILVAISIAATWTYFSNKRKEVANQSQTEATTEEVKVSNLANLDPSDFDDFVRSEYSLATDKATSASNDYKLAMIEVDIGNSLTPESVNTRYIFNKTNDIANNWVITISTASSNFIRALIPVEDYAGALTQVDTALWKFNYVTALQLAEKNGGLAWREQNTLTGVVLYLKDDNNLLAWIVEYDGAGSNKIIKIDASTGKII